MNTPFLIATGIALCTLGFGSVAHADGIVVEGNGARAQGDWGGEAGLGYSFDAGGFALRPIVGGFFSSGNDMRAYGKVEATYTIPLSAELGAGARISGDKSRIYATASLPLAPRIRMKANVGDRYYALGLRASF